MNFSELKERAATKQINDQREALISAKETYINDKASLLSAFTHKMDKLVPDCKIISPDDTVPATLEELGRLSTVIFEIEGCPYQAKFYAGSRTGEIDICFFAPNPNYTDAINQELNLDVEDHHWQPPTFQSHLMSVSNTWDTDYFAVNVMHAIEDLENTLEYRTRQFQDYLRAREQAVPIVEVQDSTTISNPRDDAERFCFWVSEASYRPGRLAQALEHCITPHQYRTAIDQLMDDPSPHQDDE
jgi:hypothetical protein